MEFKEKKILPPNFHLAPQTGWLNDPNGLCQLDGVNHIFFQYSPSTPFGGDKDWGHYATKDFINYEFTGVFMEPDIPEDRSGVYSGSALVEDGQMYIYYTGNVKQEGDYDYILSGREANTILVTSKDGVGVSSKEILLRNKEYPDGLTQHVRDPKVFKKKGTYYLLLGARKIGDEGCALLFKSKDKRKWSFIHFIEKPDFGYMWECPDLLYVDGRQFLSASPQGLKSEKFKYQNVYQSGYFTTRGDLLSDGKALGDFTEWDYGFDFYAPQTYVDEKGRVILIAWLGMPDAEYGHDVSVEDGWQHMLSIPRELKVDESTGLILQKPLAEMENLRKEKVFAGKVAEFNEKVVEDIDTYELNLLGFDGNDFELTFNKDFKVSYSRDEGVLTYRFTNGELGSKRGSRRTYIGKEPISDMRIFVDTCAIEIFINRGKYTFTTKYFMDKNRKQNFSIIGNANMLVLHKLGRFNIRRVNN